MNNLENNERIDYLFDTPLRIIQSSDVFSFSLDAVLLAKFVHVPIQKGNIMDLCTGNGAVALMLSTRTKAHITGVEIQPRLADMAKRSVVLNKLEDRLTILCEDAKTVGTSGRLDRFDVVTCNPPYFSSKQSPIQNPNSYLAIARHEIELTLEEAIRAASQLLRQRGKAAFVHRPERLMEILTIMEKHRLIPKLLQFVHPKSGKAANIVLVEAIKDGSAGITVPAPIHVYDEKGNYSKELLTFVEE